MANPRQRKKGRSSSHRPVSHARHAKRNLKKTPPIRGPASAVLSALWDKKRTVRQNYAALGLIHTLNPSASGGVEPIEVTAGRVEDSPVNLTAASTSSQSNTTPPIPKGHGRIIRDEEGNVLRIEFAEEDEEMPEEDDDRDKNMEELEPEMDLYLRQKWVTGLGGGKGVGGDGDVVEVLERISSANHNATTLSAAISGAGPRHASGGEVAYLQRLVDKYGTDVEQMARDRKLNPEQRTVGQLTRSLKRCGFGGS
ncbi:ribosome biogenesis protein Nop16 [Mycena alexandri]|uniref:Nucleolar protein 16 n=1 Tax=Mycena alexandri TaxID=1745969 RepID=A0AAD6XCD9_9AGAR|nr:ribosome biogenesis protein Nop16 [Mycena alexandri]